MDYTQLGNVPLSVAVVVPVLDRRDLLKQCYKGLLETHIPKGVDLKFVWVDNSESSAINQTLNSFRGTVIRNELNVGFPRACNQGARSVGWEYCLFLNADMILPPIWLEIMLGYFYQHKSEDIGIIGPVGRTFNPAVAGSKPIPPGTHDAGYIVGACLMMNRLCWNMTKGFDVTYSPAFFEDIDICYAARKHGLKVRQVGGFQPKHGYGVSVRATGNTVKYMGEDVNLDAITNRNRDYFKQKWSV